MMKNKTNLENTNPKSLIAELIFLACLCIIALRATFTEGIQSSSTTPQLNSIVVSLTFSFILIVLFAFWCYRLIFSAKLTYRFTAIEIPLILFLIAAGVSVYFASNKRLAINSLVILTSPVMLAVLLIQITDRPSKVKILLIVIAALGFLSTVQCLNQLFSDNNMAVQQYQQDPESMLKPLGISKGTFQQFLFEHRLYSKGINSFFMTSNSAGSFSILASFAAFALFYNSLKRFKAGLISRDPFIATAVAFAAVAAGLIITKSKGAIASAFISALILAFYLKFPKIVKTNPKKLLTLAVSILLLAAAVVVYLGQIHDTLPGGNSMLVRWQYWKSTVQMAVDHLLIGVGPGNFGSYYTQYKIPAALETVADPHNFILSILTQFGIFGLLAFLAMIIFPIKKALAKCNIEPVENTDPEKSIKASYLIYLVIISVVLLIVRPMLFKVNIASQDIIVVIYVVIVFYIMPVLLFATGGCMFTCSQKNDDIETDSVTSAAIFCGIIAVLIHNLIDFAIFEPSIYTTLWVMIAALAALNLNKKTIGHTGKNLPIYIKSILIIPVGALVLASFVFAFYLPAKADALIKTAIDRPADAISLLQKASQADPLNTDALSMSGKVFMYQYGSNPTKNMSSLTSAMDNLLEAVKRDPADYKNYEKLVDIYILIAQRSEGSLCEKNLQIALNYAEKAVQRYPGSATIRFKYALVADQLKMTTLATDQYLKAIEIEDSFAAQFKIMYPTRDIVSRLDSNLYNQAKSRAQQLMLK
ncbi:MAG TPA: O-antigen ligase family protein [Sedimentisphaerales bacterium]|nr:O-antigen ligase family protein [Sedimentisphaerales bacterium]